MKPQLLLLLLILSLVDSSAAPPKEKFPFKYGGFFDGGTIYIEDVRTKEDGSVTICFDGNKRSKTSGRFYLGSVHPNMKAARLASPKEVKRTLATILEILQNYFGAEVLGKISKLNNLDEIPPLHLKHSSFSEGDIYQGASIYHFIMRHSEAEQDAAPQDRPLSLLTY